jgi:transposase
MAKSKEVSGSRKPRRIFGDEFKQEAAQMMLDGHTAASVSKNLGIGNTNLFYRWKAEILARSGPAAKVLDVQTSSTSAELDSPYRSRRPVCSDRISISTCQSEDASKHEPRWRLLRQCLHGIVLWND